MRRFNKTNQCPQEPHQRNLPIDNNFRTYYTYTNDKYWLLNHRHHILEHIILMMRVKIFFNNIIPLLRFNDKYTIIIRI